ncbi:hypothetical protein EDC04DRAFT_3123797 [Pisolithus marmoratus]|nr:hypothetical protein EDC04DRAFT_3123797 [Pisolithus marmoratus]
MPPSEREAEFYYAGLPSAPRLVARTGTTPWEEPIGPEAYRKIRELRAVGNHAIKKVWEDNLALELHALLDQMKVKWISTDVIRIGYAKKPYFPVILWIGVMPQSLSGDYGLYVTSKCQQLLRNHNITDVDVEIRESVVTRSAGPKLLHPSHSANPTVDVREPLTPTLGLPICSQSTPSAEGTGGFFITEGGNTSKLLLVTARHVVFPLEKCKNVHYKYKNKSQPRHNVMVLGNAAFDGYLQSIQSELMLQTCQAEHLEQVVEEQSKVEGTGDQLVNWVHQQTQRALVKAKEAMKQLKTFYKEVSTHWTTSENRVLGHVILSPPINVGSEGYTEDWAVIEIDASKIDASNFAGNAIDLGTRISVPEFTRKMYTNPQNAEFFIYPYDRLLRLNGTISDHEMRHPTSLDQNNVPCLLVIKRGGATSLTVGCANDVCSFVRHYHGPPVKTSKEWAILPFDSRSGAFSAEGDSGSVIVDGFGHIGGLITSGAGSTAGLDITYATPISFLLERLQANGLRELNINPVFTDTGLTPGENGT